MTAHSHELLISEAHPFIAVSGITCRSSADAAVAFGARCLIFDFLPESLHYLSVERAADIASANVGRIGRLAARDLTEIPEIMQRARLDYVCLSGACEPQEAARVLGVHRIIRDLTAVAEMQRETDAWAACCAAFRIPTGNATRTAFLRISRPRIRPDAGFADGVELLSGANLLREVLTVQSAT